jgi:hypothetical protein
MFCSAVLSGDHRNGKRKNGESAGKSGRPGAGIVLWRNQEALRSFPANRITRVPKSTMPTGSGTGAVLVKLTCRLSIPIVAGQSTKSSSVAPVTEPLHIPMAWGATSVTPRALVEVPSLPDNTVAPDPLCRTRLSRRCRWSQAPPMCSALCPRMCPQGRLRCQWFHCRL